MDQSYTFFLFVVYTNKMYICCITLFVDSSMGNGWTNKIVC